MNPYYQDAYATIYLGDCLSVMPMLSPVSLLLTDPPYGCGKADWDESFPRAWYREGRRLAETVAIITGSAGLKDSVALVGDDFVDVISGRNLNGMTRGPIGFGNWLAVVVAGQKPPQGWNAFDFAVCGHMPKHPSPKPLEFMEKIVSRLAPKPCLILDPFMGSGTTLKAAKDRGHKAIGIDVNEQYCEMAAKRLRQEPLPLCG